MHSALNEVGAYNTARAYIQYYRVRIENNKTLTENILQIGKGVNGPRVSGGIFRYILLLADS